jgi:hypothetical protein
MAALGALYEALKHRLCTRAHVRREAAGDHQELHGEGDVMVGMTR